jgi:hypothetical protein
MIVTRYLPDDELKDRLVTLLLSSGRSCVPLLLGSDIWLEDERLVVVVENETFKEWLLRPPRSEKLGRAVREVTGRERDIVILTI